MSNTNDPTHDILGHYRPVLRPGVRHSFDLHRVAMVEKDWLAAGIWGAVFLEGFLEDALLAKGISTPERPDLGVAINRLRGAKGLDHARDIVDKCEAIRLARNSLVHARANTGAGLDTAAMVIGNYLGEILDLAKSWFPIVSPAPTAYEPEEPPEIGRVFLSTITPHLPRQEFFIRDLKGLLRRKGIEPVVFVPDEYDKKDPVGGAIRAIQTCDAILCVGLSRYHSYFLVEREGGKEPKEVTHRYFTSAWLHIEAGAAFALNMPVFVLCEESIGAEGIFDKEYNSSPPFIMTSDSLSIHDPAIERCLQRLRERLAVK